jgi:glycosyltransferase involved in cell wall biosynthesis
MRILVNDHAGHPFQVQLSRALATRGHEVMHSYTANLQTPRGALTPTATDPDGFQVQPIQLSKPFERYGMLSRHRQEQELGRQLARLVHDFRPQVVVSANTPLIAQAKLQSACRSNGIGFIYWLQDLLGIGIKNALTRRLPVIGSSIGSHFQRLEQRLLRNSTRVVVITDDFLPVCASAGVPPGTAIVIENWAPLSDIPVLPKRNPWSTQQGVAETFNFIYAGTLGMKHNPQLLVELARSLTDADQARLIIISEGLGADFLAAEKRSKGLEHLDLLPFQSFERMPEILASADVLLTLLEPDAGIFAVPSKVLTNLCAQRAQLLAVPPENLAARIVERQQAGLVVPPQELRGFLVAARALQADTTMRARMADNGRAYAEQHFDIAAITDRFESILESCQA